jgi:hypothetical protein
MKNNLGRGAAFALALLAAWSPAMYAGSPGPNDFGNRLVNAGRQGSRTPLRLCDTAEQTLGLSQRLILDTGKLPTKKTRLVWALLGGVDHQAKCRFEPARCANAPGFAAGPPNSPA